MKTGWHIMSDTEYFGRSKDMNASHLVDIYTWGQYQDAGKPTNPTAAMQKGTALHLAVLQPELFRERVHRGIDGDKRKKENKQKEAELKLLIENYPEKFILDSGAYDLVLAMSKAVKENDIAQDLLQDCSFEEVGLKLMNIPTIKTLTPPPFAKIKLDARKNGIIIDVKTTSAKSVYEIQKSIEDFHYDMKAAYYFEVANAIEDTLKTSIHYDRFFWIFVTNYYPCHCIVYEMSEDDIIIGRHKYKAAYDMLKHYFKTGKADLLLECPAWKQKRYDHYLGA